MPLPNPTANELVAAIQRSSLPTVLVEGPFDVDAYRWIERRFGIGRADVLPCGGRTRLLEVFNRRSEFSAKKVAFLADQDMFVFSGIPSSYRDIVWTEGYCIENDILAGSSIEDLLSPAEVVEYNKYLLGIARWFAFEVEEHRAGRTYWADVKISELFSTSVPPDPCPVFLSRRAFVEPSQHTKADLMANYRLKLRGKTLFDVLVRITHLPGRYPQIGRPRLVELGTMPGTNPLLNRIALGLQRFLV